MTSIVDIHPHIISDDETRYPPAPLFGKRSDWSQERPTTVETLIAAMDEAGVAKAAVVHSSTTYGFDNRYVVDGCAKYADRLVAVGSVDVLQPDAAQRIREWVGRGLAGLRLFTGGSTKEFDPSELDDPRSFAAWELCGELGLPMCIQTGPIGLPQVTALARRFPNVAIILDHLGRPEVADGAPYAQAQEPVRAGAAVEHLPEAHPAHFRRREEGKGERRNVFPARGRSVRRKADGLGLELSDLAGHAAGNPRDGAGRSGKPERRRPRVDLRQDGAATVSGSGLILRLYPGRPPIGAERRVRGGRHAESNHT